MITSDRQLSVKAAKIQTQALIEELESDVFGYEELKTKGLDAIELNDLAEIMLIPIKYRIAKKMTQESFAKEVEIPLRMIARYESEGHRNITGENFHKILLKLHFKMPGKLREA